MRVRYLEVAEDVGPTLLVGAAVGGVELTIGDLFTGTGIGIAAGVLIE